MEREVGRFDNYLNENVALEHQEGFREQVFKEFENLKCKFEQVDELSNCQINPEDSVSNITENTRLTSSSSIALAQVDLQLEKKKLAIKAQMELEEARLEAKLEKLKILSRSREGSKTGSRLETKSIGTSTKSRDSLYSVALSSSSPQMAKKSQVRGSDPKSTDSLSHGNAGSVLEGGQGPPLKPIFILIGKRRQASKDAPMLVARPQQKVTSKTTRIWIVTVFSDKNPILFTELRDHRFNSAPESRLDKVLPRENVKLPPRFAVLRNKLGSQLIECDEPSARNCSSKNDCCIVSPVNSVSNGQQEIFFENQNNKIFLVKAALIQYDGSNMAFIFFKNRIEALINECPSKGMKLMLLETACVKSASQIIINLVADNPNLSELERVDMSLRRLELRFGRKGGFLGEPDVRRYRYGPKLTSGSADAIRRFKVDLDKCALYASAYKKTEKLEGCFVLDLAKRLPPDVRQRYLDFLLHHFESTNDPSFQSLVDFVNREETSDVNRIWFYAIGDESEHKEMVIRHPSIELDKLLQVPICLLRLLVVFRTVVVTTVVLRNVIDIRS